MRVIYLLVSVLILSLGACSAGAQSRPYNLGLNSGLPTNHIYTVAEDYLGYLWVGTPKGVVRYNGYEPRVFNVDDGLPTEDVWYLLEDAKGRLWLSNVSNELGYMKNERYYAVIRNSPELIYPIETKRYRDGIIVLKKGAILSATPSTWEVITYDSLGLKTWDTKIGAVHQLFLNEALLIVAFKLDGKYSLLQFPGKTWSVKYYSDDYINARLAEGTFGNLNNLFHNYVFFLKKNDYCLYAKSLVTGNCVSVYPDKKNKEKMVFAYSLKYRLHVVGTRYIYEYDTLFQLKQRYALEQLTGGEKAFDDKPYILTKLPFWGTLLGTADKGLYINNETKAAFIREKNTGLEDYSFAGSITDVLGLWWNVKTHRLLTIAETGQTVVRHVPEINEIRVVVPLSGDSSLMFTDKDIYAIKRKNYKATDFFSVGLSRSPARQDAYIMPKSVVATGKDTLFVLDGGAYHIFSRMVAGKHTNLLLTHYDHLMYDPFHASIWLYRNHQIAFYDIKTNTSRIWNQAMLQNKGVRKVEHIIIDPVYGNVFIKDYDHVLLWNDTAQKAIPLFTSYRYGNNTRMLVQGNMLVVAGRFGVLYSPIIKKGVLGAARVYENIKDVYYRSVYDINLLGKKLILNTDRGVYTLQLNSGDAKVLASGNTASGPRFILNAGDSAMHIHTNDTLLLAPGTLSLQLDLVNPKGTGKLQFACLADRTKGWNNLKGTEINLGGLSPGKFHLLRIKARDDVWQSDELVVRLYIKPYWWQTSFFSFVLALASLMLVGAVIWITRKVVIAKQAQRQHMLDMGLTGVYAQISPHFIFNSLTTAQLFIKSNKVQEAYTHINRFSRLLRNFLHASKHKYITIQEEITHLSNYIELQQIRFKEQFDYKIRLMPGVDPGLKIPSLLLQPLVENAIQHGLLCKENKGLLTLTFVMEQKDLVILIDDDGIGRKEAANLQRPALKTESFGNDLIHKLIYIFNRYEKIRISLSYIDKELPETGTIVKIIISSPFS